MVFTNSNKSDIVVITDREVKFMINVLEHKFIKKCIVERMQDRLLFEFGGKKRKKGIGRFCHNTDDLLEPENIFLKSNQLDKDEIIMSTRNFLQPEQCRIVAYNEDLDKIECSFSRALELVLSNGMSAIIISDNFAFIETEQCYGMPTRYIVKF